MLWSVNQVCRSSISWKRCRPTFDSDQHNAAKVLPCILLKEPVLKTDFVRFRSLLKTICAAVGNFTKVCCQVFLVERLKPDEWRLFEQNKLMSEKTDSVLWCDRRIWSQKNLWPLWSFHDIYRSSSCSLEDEPIHPVR